jgi:DNA-binding transcriptional LysR family regulator
MELRQLRYFLALARTQNFTRAAAEMHIAQPPLSRQISQLEEELGTLLVDREARPLRLTLAGELFRDSAEEVLGRIDRMKADARRLGQSGQRTFRMGVEAFAVYGRFPQFIRRLRAASPQLRIEIRELAARSQPAAIKAGEIDAGVAHLRVSDPALEQVVVREEPLAVALPAGHRLAKAAPAPIALQELADETFIQFSSLAAAKAAHPTYRFLAEQAFQPKDVIETSALQVALGLVAADSGVCIVPAIVQRMRTDDVCYRTLAEPGARSPTILTYSREHTPALIPTVLELIATAGDASEA